MIKAILIIFALLFVPVQSMAQSPLNFELAQNRVDITTGFNGTNIVAFGSFKNSSDVALVVTLRGPETTMIVRQKERGITGVWGNADDVEFRRVLSYYDYAVYETSQKLPMDESVLNDTKIGVENLGFYPERNLKPEMLERFQDALIRTMRLKGFYPIKSGAINFYGDDLFKATFALPPDVPTGTYSLEAIVFKDDKVVARQTRTLQVGQVGFNARVYIYATQYSFLYGVLSVLLALVFGWSAFTFLRRD